MAKTRVSEASSGAFLEVLLALRKGNKRYSELKKTLKRSDKTISDSLKRASNYNLITKKAIKKKGDVFAVYSITPRGNKFVREVLEWETKLSK